MTGYLDAMRRHEKEEAENDGLGETVGITDKGHGVVVTNVESPLLGAVPVVSVERRPDPKPAPRIVDGHVIREFRESGQDCISCGHGRGIQAHHILSRAQRGDDVPANLAPLCLECHGAYHGTPYKAFGVRIDAGFVRAAIGRYIASEAGDDTRWYLTGKLGVEGSVVFLERLGVSG